jgi:hypothetical protein
LIKANSEEDYANAFHQIRERFRALEINQHHGDVALRAEPARAMKIESS